MPEPMTDLTDMRRYSNQIRLLSERRIEALTQQLVDGDIDLATWQEDMKAELRQANLQQFVTGRGGTRKGVTRKDYLTLGPELKRQYAFLNRFAAVIQKAADNESPLTFAIERAKLYARSTQAMFWKAAVPVKLPQVPRDGKTQCGTNCKCRLRIEYERDEDGNIIAVNVWWLLRPAEHCEDCKDLSEEWNPKRIEVDGEVTESDTEQAVDLLLMMESSLHHISQDVRKLWGLGDDNRNMESLTHEHH